MMRQKQVFRTIFALLAILLVILPFLVSFNEALTKLVEKFALYSWIQDQIVPIEVKIVTLLLSMVGISVGAAQNGFWVKGTFLEMTWNCIGWQSLLLLTITLVVGLKSGNFTHLSKLEAITIALLGTFIINLLRLTFIVILFTISRPIYAILYHDYLAAIITVVWLIFFWWFAYAHVLEEKIENI